MQSNKFGVWASKNGEYVRAAHYSLLFLRQGPTISAMLSKVDGDVTVNAKAVYNVEEKSCIAKALGVQDGKLFFDIDTNNEIKLKGTIQEELVSDNQLSISVDKFSETLELVEKINISKPYKMPQADENNIGECLLSWGLGVSVSQEGDLSAFTIGTPKHLYTFTVGQMNGENVSYCRAARAKHLNKGTVFAQNIRLMMAPHEFTVRMQPDNLEVSKSEVEVDETLFTSDTCTFGDQGIYWSLKSFSEDEIVLNGCRGDEYNIGRPQPDDPNILEWFTVTE